MKRSPGVPQPYIALLNEYRATQKKPRLEGSSTKSPPGPQYAQADPPPGQLPALDDFSSEDEWDEVELEDQDVEFNDVEISFKKPTNMVHKKDTIPRSFKLQVHGTMFALLLAHTRIRNFWTQDRTLSTALRGLMPSIILQQLVPPNHLSPTLKTKSLLEGLRQAAKWWNEKFTVTNIGLYMVGWDEFKNRAREVEGPVTKLQFIESISEARGSLDLLGQGFCALLRAHGFACRLVASIQPPNFMAQGSSKKTGQKASIYPIYWTEVWDKYELQWISVDPVTGTAEFIRRGSPLEPPQNDTKNLLRYCIAWFRDGTARDVTRRYASKYSARTRKKRMEVVPRYAKIYNTLMARFAPKSLEPRDIKELKDLYRRERAEGIPSRITDFIGHPLYCLEHQLKKTEILEPKISTGTLALKGEVIPIYPRKNVKQCRSAQTWYRQGRVLVPGSQPKKHRSKRDKLSGVEEKVPLYTLDQTEWFKPAPVEDGIVPKSEYRTIDVFTRSMVPAGGVHLTDPLAQRAAKILRVDYANAVVSVDFTQRGMGPKSKYSGIVVAREYRPAIEQVIRGLQKQEKQDQKRQDKAKILYLWKQFMVAAQIRRRVDGNDLGFEITDTEPWPLEVPTAMVVLSESEIDSSDEEPVEGTVVPTVEKALERDVEVPEPPVRSTNVQVPMTEVLYQQEVLPTQKKSPTHSDFEDDEEYPDMMLDGLNESDFDI